MDYLLWIWTNMDKLEIPRTRVFWKKYPKWRTHENYCHGQTLHFEKGGPLQARVERSLALVLEPWTKLKDNDGNAWKTCWRALQNSNNYQKSIGYWLLIAHHAKRHNINVRNMWNMPTPNLWMPHVRILYIMLYLLNPS